MNLQALQWTKNVLPASGGWAYSEFKIGKLFKLAWKDVENANEPKRNDLILLRQHGYVTHLVKVLNREVEREDWQGDFNIYRIVEVLWAIDCSNPPIEAKADTIFDYPEVLDYRHGNIMKLQELPTFTKRWGSELSSFQAHVKSRLLAISSPI